jgi:hypothetical protein
MAKQLDQHANLNVFVFFVFFVALRYHSNCFFQRAHFEGRSPSKKKDVGG